MFLQRRYKNGQQAHEKMFHLLTIREMQMKNKMKYHHIPNKMETIKSTEIKRVSEDMEKLEHLGTVEGSVTWRTEWTFHNILILKLL